MSKFIGISQLSKILGLIDPVTKKPLNYVLRYWEKEFKDIKPKKINNRRYYSTEQVETIKTIKFLLKDKGLTIFGVKNLIKFKINKLDEINDSSLKAEYYKSLIKFKSKILLDKVNKIKKHGKKNSS